MDAVQCRFMEKTMPELVKQLTRVADVLEATARYPQPPIPMPNVIEQAYRLKWDLAPGWEKINSEYPVLDDGEWAMNLRLLSFVPDNLVGVVEHVMRHQVDDLSELTDSQFKVWAAKALLALNEVWKLEGVIK
jgi:hypothetical protein